MKNPELIQGAETKYQGRYPAWFTDGKKVYKVIDSSCTANARQLLCDYVGVPYDGRFFERFKELNPNYQNHVKLFHKLGYTL